LGEPEQNANAESEVKEIDITVGIVGAIQAYEFSFMKYLRDVFLSEDILANNPREPLNDYLSFLHRVTEAKGMKKLPIIMEVVAKLKVGVKEKNEN